MSSDDPLPSRQQVVTLDGIAIPLVDPQNFQEFWNEREEQRIREQENLLRYSSKTKERTNREEKIEKSPSFDGGNTESKYPGTNRIGTSNPREINHPGALALYGEGSGEEEGRIEDGYQDNLNNHRNSRMTNSGRNINRQKRPQSAQRQRSSNRRGDRPSSAHPSTRMSRTAPSSSSSSSSSSSFGNSGRRPKSAQTYKRRPKSARLSGTTGIGARRTKDGVVIRSGGEADRRLVMENYAKSIKAQRQVRKTSSLQYIKLRASKRRQQAKQFADSLKSEERKRKVEIRSKVSEMNKWALANGNNLNYSVVEDMKAGAHGIAIHVTESGRFIRRLIVVTFEREHEKMKIEMDRKKAIRALTTSENASSTKQGKSRIRGRSRQAVQNELKSILADTETLTETLISQLKELRSYGWNVGYL